jgi:hypothetical protein
VSSLTISQTTTPGITLAMVGISISTPTHFPAIVNNVKGEILVDTKVTKDESIFLLTKIMDKKLKTQKKKAKKERAPTPATAKHKANVKPTPCTITTRNTVAKVTTTVVSVPTSPLCDVVNRSVFVPNDSVSGSSYTSVDVESDDEEEQNENLSWARKEDTEGHPGEAYYASRLRRRQPSKQEAHEQESHSPRQDGEENP